MASSKGSPSWATIVARNGSENKTIQPAEPRRKVISIKHLHEILIRAPNQPAELANREPKEIIETVRKASRAGHATAVRRLPSGDIAVVFDGDTGPLRENTDWAT